MRLAVCAMALVAAIVARADSPELKAINPVGASRGTTNVFTLSGKLEPWPPKFWCSPGGLRFKAETNKNKVAIEVPSDALPGPRLIRVFNADGASEPRFFVVGDGREENEKEPNNHLAEAQPATFPITINGRLDKNDDVDCYRVDLKAGEWLDASLEAYTLMSKFDGVLKLVTTNGVTLAWNHDFETFDPHLWWHAPADTTAILQVFGFLYPANSDIRLSGGEEAYYRLHLERTAPPTWSNTTSTNVDLPFEARGTIEKAGEEKRFPFRAHKGDFIEARVKAATLGWPLDPWIKIVNATGQEVAKQDDSDGSPDPRLEWKCGADTNFFFVVGSTLNRGATNYHFELEAAVVPPDFRVTWADPTVVLTVGATNVVKVNVKRVREHTNELIAEFWDLPPGVNANAGSISNKTGEISFTLTAETNAPAFQGPIRLIVTDAKTKRAKAAVVELVTRGENNGVPNGYSKLAIESYDHCWLTVKPAAKPPITTAASK